MKSLLPVRDWSITTTLILVAIVPPFVVSVVVTVALYISGKGEVAEAVELRGRLIATTLAETSQYGVISGNLAYLERSIEQLCKADPSIAGIVVLNAKRHVLAATKITDALHSNDAAPFIYERPVGNLSQEIDMFVGTTGPHVSEPTPASFRDQEPAGFVIVTMSQDRIIAEKRRRLGLGISVVLAATLFGGLTGLLLAQRLRLPLREVMLALKEIRRGNFEIQLSSSGSGEIGVLKRTILEMVSGLRISKLKLEERVAQRTKELQLAIDAASQADAEKRRLIARGNELVEEERYRISAEIHDHLGASLTVVNMKANHIETLASSGPIAPERAAEIERVAQAISVTTQGLYSKARDIVRSLRPEVIDTLGLKRAIADMVRNYDEIHPACEFTFFSGTGFPDLRGSEAITAYRLVQEALTNVVKHSSATKSSIRLDRLETLQMMILTVADTGIGFDPSARPLNSVGLIGMRERVSASGGTMHIESTPNRGTTIVFRLPLPKQPPCSSPDQ
jgi:two-component system sensor histidine kinase UhpB